MFNPPRPTVAGRDLTLLRNLQFRPMFLGEPSATQADLHFRLFGLPVRVHPFFWVVAVLMGLRPDRTDPLDVVVWVAVVFASILVHEMGHASLQRFYGGHPWITLYAFGGLASCSDGPRSAGRRLLILLAGPGAGFIFAAIIIAAIMLSGHQFGITTLKWLEDSQIRLRNPEPVGLLGPVFAYFEGFPSPIVNEGIRQLLYVNILWGLVNLLPVYPLDGGQIARELFNIQYPRNGVLMALQLSAGTAVLIAAYALLNQRIYLALLFGYLAYGNFQSIQFTRNHWR
jgi:stage IV sporulation protein FB